MRSCCSRNGLFLFLALGFLVYFVVQNGVPETQLRQLWTKEILKSADAPAAESLISVGTKSQREASKSNRTRTGTTVFQQGTTKGTVPAWLNQPTTTPSPRIFKVAPDEKWVILHTYMRGGSSFLGMLFEKNPEAFYMFEPLYPIYLGMLGVINTFHPLRIYAYKNATWRTQGEEEKNYLVNSLLHMYTCNFKELPEETLSSNYMDFTNVYNYTKCTRRRNITNYFCGLKVRENCPPVAEDAFRHNCHLYMAKIHNDSSFSGIEKLNSTAFARFPEVKYQKNCLLRLKQTTSKCLPLIEKPCERSKLKIFKVVRGNVDLIKKMMEINPNTYVIHQVRDPRGIIPSRRSTVTLSFEAKLEGKLLCEKMNRELDELAKLRQVYPNRVKHLRYEDMAQDAIATAQSVYMFLGEKMPKAISVYLNSATHADKKGTHFSTERKNSTETAFAWRKTIPKDIKLSMDKDCVDLYKRLHYDLT